MQRAESSSGLGDGLIEVPEQGEAENSSSRAQQPLPSPWLVALQLLLMTCVVVIIWLPWGKVRGYFGFISDGQVSWIAFMNACLSAIFGFLSWLLSRQHARALRHGLMAFTFETRALRQFPSFCMAAGNVLLLLLWSLWPQDQPVYIGGYEISSKVNAEQILVTIECAIMTPPMIRYMARLIRLHAVFAAEEPAADPSRPGAVPPGPGAFWSMPQSPLDHEYGQYYAIDAYACDMVEKQADYIEVLQSHKSRLTSEIGMLANELRYLRRTDAEGSLGLGNLFEGSRDHDATAAHMRDAIDSELRAAQVERDELRRELETAESLREEAERTIEHYKASLQREGEQSTVLLASVEEMRTELQIVTVKLGRETEEKAKLQGQLRDLKKRTRRELEAER